jgi:glycyl-tRNA synthetase beta chain
MSRGEFLLEILCEEIPANALPSIREQLAEAFRAELSSAGYEGFTVTTYSTVRRLVVHVAGLPAMQPDREEEVFGPPVRAAFSSDGSPTPAALGFAKGQGVAVDKLRVAQGPKGEVVAATKQLPGRPTPAVLAEICEKVVPALHVPKAMRWGSGEHSFVRPVHRIAALFGAGTLTEKVPVTLFGVVSNCSTVGHRIVNPGRLDLKGAAGFVGYRERLAEAGVVLDPAERLRMIEKRATELAREVGCEVRPDPELVAEMAEFVECPGILRGVIAPRFLELPEEVLVTTLRHHQKCLVLTRDGAVAPFFLAVFDRPDDPEGHVQRGNEWVAGARLADAEFFFGKDRKTPLAARRDALEKVVFHQKLGSFARKAQLVESLAAALATEASVEVAPEVIARACGLMKLDLTTSLVGEFPELQGVMGGIYARLEGEPAEVWQAVADQYLPVGLEGPLPRGPLGALVGVADRMDTLAGLFAAGEIPSGSKDPFALRRAALAVVRICAEAPLQCDLREAAHRALMLRQESAAGAVEKALEALCEFLQERERFYLTAVAGVAPEVADAVIAARWGLVAEDVARARALEQVRGEEVFASLAVAFKRVRNMVSKSGKGRLVVELLKEPAEKELLAAVGTVEKEVERTASAGDHGGGLRALAKLAAPLDRFFTDVLVLCEDGKVRAARLALLARIEKLFLRLADVSRLSAQ